VPPLTSKLALMKPKLWELPKPSRTESWAGLKTTRKILRLLLCLSRPSLNNSSSKRHLMKDRNLPAWSKLLMLWPMRSLLILKLVTKQHLHNVLLMITLSTLRTLSQLLCLSFSQLNVLLTMDAPHHVWIKNLMKFKMGMKGDPPDAKLLDNRQTMARIWLFPLTEMWAKLCSKLCSKNSKPTKRLLWDLPNNSEN